MPFFFFDYRYFYAHSPCLRADATIFRYSLITSPPYAIYHIIAATPIIFINADARHVLSTSAHARCYYFFVDVFRYIFYRRARR